MKQTLAMAALALCTSSVFANGREYPVPKTTSIVFEDTVYLYNTSAKLFLDQNSVSPYYTVASASAIKVVPYKYVEEGAEWDGKSVYFKDYMPAKNAWYYLYFYSESNASVYGSSMANAHWYMETNGDSFRLSLGDYNADYDYGSYAGSYFGLDKSNSTNKYFSPFLVPTDANASNYMLDWAFVTQADYAEYTKRYEVYSLAMQLSNLIVTASARGIETSAAQGIYDNEASTVEELQNAIAALNATIAEKATPDNPVDMTDKITNPGYDNTSLGGWESVNVPTITGSGVAYKSEGNMDLQQKLTGLPSGIYIIDAQAFSKASGTDNSLQMWKDGTQTNAWLFAESAAFRGEKNIMHVWENAIDHDPGVSTSNREGLYIPATSGGPSAGFFNLGLYHNSVMCLVEDGDLTIGMYKNASLSSDFTAIDNWTLNYIGKSFDAYKYWREAMLLDMYKIGKKSELFCQSATYDKYTEAYEAFANSSTSEDFLSALNALKNEKNQLLDNIDAYAAWRKLYDDAANAISELEDDELSDYMLEADAIIQDCSLTTDEMIDEAAKLKVILSNAYKNGMKPGTDCTSLIANPNFNDGWNGWTIDPTLDTPEGKFTYANPMISANKTYFRINQTISNLTPGVYKLSVQACDRTVTADSLYYQSYLNGEKPRITTFITANGCEAPVCSMLDWVYETKPSTGSWNDVGFTGKPGFIVNSSTAFVYAIEEGAYDCSVYGVVGEDGILNIGIYKVEPHTSSYALFDNFRLEYEGYDPDIIASILNEALDKATPYVADDAKLQNAVKKELIEQVEKTTSEISAALPAKELVANLMPLNTLIEKAAESVKEYETMSSVATDLNAAITAYKETATEAALAGATSLYDEIENAYAAAEVSADEIKQYKQSATEYESMLRIPNTYEAATEQNPIDFTSVIVNPNYDSDATTGWTCKNGNPGYGSSAGEFFNTKFDYSQTLYGLPAGSYKLSLQAFYRFGGYEAAANARTDGNEKSLVTLFANDASIEVASIFTEATMESGSGFTTNTVCGYVPNSMSDARSCFDSSTDRLVYLNELSFTVGAGDYATVIGLIKSVAEVNDWCLFDNWQLTYYGASGSTDGVKSVNTSATALSTEYYTANGIRTATPQKGVNIVKRQYSDGSVKTMKVVVK